jgi:hypothetical protein
MFRYLVAAALVCAIASCGSTTSFQQETAPLVSGDARGVSAITDATAAWNSVCGQYNFIPKPQLAHVTFAQGYFGQNFSADIQAITNHVNQILGALPPSTGNDIMGALPPSTGNDIMKFKIENWQY